MVVAGLFFSVLLAMWIGRYPICLNKIWQDISGMILSKNVYGTISTDLQVVLLRIPRICMAIMVGASLSASGMVYQCLFRNPLVSPDILGVSSGACLGAALAIVFSCHHPFVLQSFAFLFGIIAVLLTYWLASVSKNRTIITLVMSGIVVSSFCGALLSLLKYTADPYRQLPEIVFWIMGGLYQVSWQDIYMTFPFVGAGLLIIFVLRRNLNILSLGDEEAQNLGINVSLIRIIFITVSTVVVGVTICVTGIIGWVGLVIPHITRILFGINHTHSLPYAMLIGGCFVLWMDTLARSITSQEIPIGIITALVGAPFFAYLLLFKQNRGWGKW